MEEVVSRRFATTDLDDAVEVFASAFTGGGLRVSDYGDFHYSQDLAAVDGTAAVTQRMGARVRSSAQPGPTMFVAWTDDGTTSYLRGRQRLAADAGVLWSGIEPIVVDVEQAEVGSLVLDRADFEGRAAHLLGQDAFALPDFVPLVSADHVQAVRSHFDLIRTVLLQPGGVRSDLAWHAAQDLTVAVVLAAAGLDRPDRTTAPLPASVRRAVTYIDDHLAEPVSLGDVAAAAGLSARGLHAAFVRTTGESPMARLRRARLARARADLLAGDPSTESVAAVAVRWGFPHLGRFAGAYRAVHGELPSATLRR